MAMATCCAVSWQRNRCELCQLYQQRPAPESGDYFKAEWLKPYDKAPPLEKLRTYAACDYAVTSKGGDYTVHMIVGADNRSGTSIRCGGINKPDVWVEKMLDMARNGADDMGGRGWTNKGQCGPLIEKRMYERRVPLYRDQFPTGTTKPSERRAFVVAWRWTGCLFLPRRLGTRHSRKSC